MEKHPLKQYDDEANIERCSAASMFLRDTAAATNQYEIKGVPFILPKDSPN